MEARLDEVGGHPSSHGTQAYEPDHWFGGVRIYGGEGERRSGRLGGSHADAGQLLEDLWGQRASRLRKLPTAWLRSGPCEVDAALVSWRIQSSDTTFSDSEYWHTGHLVAEP